MKKLVLLMAGVMAGGVGVYYEWTMTPWWVAFGVAVAVLGITGAQSSSRHRQTPSQPGGQAPPLHPQLRR
jgi:hypothetical protein